MPGYRLYSFGADGSIATAQWITARDEREAVSMALTKVDGGSSFELWERDRIVGRYRKEAD